jgi:hypothetical protein
MFCIIRLDINPLNVELNPICHLLALLGAHHILHVSRIRVKPCLALSLLYCRKWDSLSRILPKKSRITIQSIDVQRHIQICSCIHCCRGKAVSTAYSELVFAALGKACNRQAPYCQLRPARLRLILSYCLINCTIFLKHSWTQNVCLDILYNFRGKHFSF